MRTYNKVSKERIKERIKEVLISTAPQQGQVPVAAAALHLILR
jgi:hypothetical protein